MPRPPFCVDPGVLGRLGPQPLRLAVLESLDEECLFLLLFESECPQPIGLVQLTRVLEKLVLLLLEPLVLLNHVFRHLLVGVLPLVLFLDDGVKLVDVRPRLMLDEKSKVHDQEGGASADSCLVMQKHFLVLYVNELVEELSAPEKIISVLCPEAVSNLTARITRDSPGVEHVAEVGAVDLPLAQAHVCLEVQYGCAPLVEDSLYVSCVRRVGTEGDTGVSNGF